LSTSHCGSSSLSLFGFGPVVGDGFGIGYMIKNNSISFNITSKNSQPWTSSAIYTLLLEESLLFMQSIAMSLPEKLNGPSKSLNFTHPTNSASFHYLDWKPSVKANSP
jgi:carnitine O-acetyltransferase